MAGNRSLLEYLLIWFVVTSLMLGTVFIPVGAAIGIDAAYQYSRQSLRQPTRKDQIAKTIDEYGEDYEVQIAPRKKH